MAQHNQGRPQHGPRDHRDDASRQAPDAGLRTSIRFAAPLDPELFNTIARNAANMVRGTDDRVNKPTQLRRFYDELLLWETRVSRVEEGKRKEAFAECLPFIRMLNAKAAYAEGRKLVDRNFVDLLHDTLNQVTSAEALTTCKYFWEAFMGFYKQERPN